MSDSPETNPSTADTPDTLALLSALLETPDDQTDEVPEDQADEGQAEEETTEEEAAPEEEESEEEEDDGKPPIEVELKHNGKTIKKSLDEVINLAQQGFDYSTKLHRVNADREEVSSLRQAVEAKETHLVQQQQTYVESLQVMEQFLTHAGIPDAALDKALQEGDTEAYLRLKNQRDKDTANLQTIRSAIKAEQEKQLERNNAYFAEQREKGKALLSEKMPHLLDPKGATELQSYLVQNFSYTPDQIAATVDPNLFIIAEKARQFDALMEKAKSRPSPVQKPQPKPLKNNKSPAPADAAKRAQYQQTLQKVRAGDKQATIQALQALI